MGFFKKLGWTQKDFRDDAAKGFLKPGEVIETQADTLTYSYPHDQDATLFVTSQRLLMVWFEHQNEKFTHWATPLTDIALASWSVSGAYNDVMMQRTGQPYLRLTLRDGSETSVPILEHEVKKLSEAFTRHGVAQEWSPG